MTRRKVVLRVSKMNNSPKYRTKAMTVAVSVAEVESVTLLKEKNEIEVMGEGVDAVKLANLLRKKVGCADILSVADVKPPPAEDATATTTATPPPPNCYYNYAYGHPYNCPYYHPY